MTGRTPLKPAHGKSSLQTSDGRQEKGGAPILPLTTGLGENTDTGGGNWSVPVTLSRSWDGAAYKSWGSRFHPVLVARHTPTVHLPWRIRLAHRVYFLSHPDEPIFLLMEDRQRLTRAKHIPYQESHLLLSVDSKTRLESPGLVRALRGDGILHNTDPGHREELLKLRKSPEYSVYPRNGEWHREQTQMPF